MAAHQGSTPPGKSVKRLTALEDLTVGGIAGVIARMFVAPFDVIKIRFQVQAMNPHVPKYTSVKNAFRTIALEEGVRALWKGNISALAMVVPYSAIQFAAFYQCHDLCVSRGWKEPYMSLASGSVGAVAATLVSYPLDLYRTIFAAQREPKVYSGFVDVTTRIWKKAGIKGFYSGCLPTILEIVPYMALQFTFYQGFRDWVLNLKSVPTLTPVDSLCIGAISGVSAKLMTLPLDNVKKRLQVQGNLMQQSYLGMFDCLVKMTLHEGPYGLFRGAVPSIVKAIPNSALHFAVYDSLKTWVLDRKKKNQLLVIQNNDP